MSFDLDAVLNDSTPFEFTFAGDGYTLPPDVPLSVPPLLREGRDGEALELLLGEEQWARVGERLGMRQATALLVAYQAHLGLTSGGSSASTDS